MGKGKGKGSEGGFSEDQLEMYRECFKLMDVDKDGVINKNDLRAAFDNIGSLVSEQELESMLGEIGGPCNYDNMVKCFEAKMSGFVNDPDDLVINAFKSYNEESEFPTVACQMPCFHFFMNVLPLSINVIVL